MEDWETGGTVSIALDPALPAAETASALYRAARKQDRTEEAAAPILADVRGQMAHLHDVDAQLQMVVPEEEGALQALAGIQARALCVPLLARCCKLVA